MNVLWEWAVLQNMFDERPSETGDSVSKAVETAAAAHSAPHSLFVSLWSLLFGLLEWAESGFLPRSQTAKRTKLAEKQRFVIRAMSKQRYPNSEFFFRCGSSVADLVRGLQFVVLRHHIFYRMAKAFLHQSGSADDATNSVSAETKSKEDIERNEKWTGDQFVAAIGRLRALRRTLQSRICRYSAMMRRCAEAFGGQSIPRRELEHIRRDSSAQWELHLADRTSDVTRVDSGANFAQHEQHFVEWAERVVQRSRAEDMASEDTDFEVPCPSEPSAVHWKDVATANVDVLRQLMAETTDWGDADDRATDGGSRDRRRKDAESEEERHRRRMKLAAQWKARYERETGCAAKEWMRTHPLGRAGRPPPGVSVASAPQPMEHSEAAKGAEGPSLEGPAAENEYVLSGGDDDGTTLGDRDERIEQLRTAVAKAEKEASDAKARRRMALEALLSDWAALGHSDVAFVDG